MCVHQAQHRGWDIMWTNTDLEKEVERREGKKGMEGGRREGGKEERGRFSRGEGTSKVTQQLRAAWDSRLRQCPFCHALSFLRAFPALPSHFHVHLPTGACVEHRAMRPVTETASSPG